MDSQYLQTLVPRKTRAYDCTAHDILSEYYPTSQIKIEKTANRRISHENSSLYWYEYGGTLVYDSSASAIPVFHGARSKGKEVILDVKEFDKQQFLKLPSYPAFKQLSTTYNLISPSQNTLVFNSKFEGGNLKKAIRVSEDAYVLLTQSDVETQGHNQWFNFSVGTYKSNHTVKFTIINYIKDNSLFNLGMKPLVYSTTANSRHRVSWEREGFDISYTQNQYPRKSSRLYTRYFSLTFSYTFQYADDLVFFAYCFPYTYTDLRKYLRNISLKSSIMRVDSLCKTVLGNDCYVLTVTDSVHSYFNHRFEQKLFEKSAAGRRLLRAKEMKMIEAHSSKKGVVIVGRVHPGETNGSYMMKGVIDFLTGPSKSAKILRKNYVFKIVPMLNPDGVVYGNSRCSIIGVDLNRRWENPHKLLHPTIYYTKKLVKNFSEVHEISMFCDLHGHSIKKNAFMYGCCEYNPDYDFRKRNVLIKLLPLVISKKNKDFSFSDSKFRIEKNKETTARVVMFKELNILNSYTLEASFYGSESHFVQGDLEKIGRDLCKSLLIFCSPWQFYQAVRETEALLANDIKPFQFASDRTFTIDQALQVIENANPELMEPNLEDSGGSDSDPSDNDELRCEFKEEVVEKTSENNQQKKKRKKKKMLRSSSRHIDDSFMPSLRHRVQTREIKNRQNFVPVMRAMRRVRNSSCSHNLSQNQRRMSRPASNQQIVYSQFNTSEFL